MQRRELVHTAAPKPPAHKGTGAPQGWLPDPGLLDAHFPCSGAKAVPEGLVSTCYSKVGGLQAPRAPALASPPSRLA